ncbi:G-type lectin S-receptor-like serine/threonine-protein kinase At2g19130 [Curcuma longa]|uniref:G-type lectin S-receptor-like serine/threonine-protein kinase At2g19130 n=1 Tax=Curcuma longa TaxID=136217 RepID=UPI003D9E134E
MAAAIASCFLISFFLSGALLVHADDRLLQGQSLSGDQTMVSKGGKFELGFFSPGNSGNYYVGIWYKVPKQQVVWVANRDAPVSDRSSSHLKLDAHGNLVILAGPDRLVWSSNSSSTFPSASAVAVLLDDGNLVLQEGNRTSGELLWQSFDHPTNTYLPRAKLGYNKLTGANRFLTSWKNLEDPSPGKFTFEIDPNGVTQFYLVKERRERYWTTGVWNGEIFSAVPEMRSGYFVNFTNVSNRDVNEFSYYVFDPNAIHNFMLDSSGEMVRRKWDDSTGEWLRFAMLPRDPCDVEGRCGAFGSCNNYSSSFCQCLQGFQPRSSKDWNLGDQTEGCIRNVPLRCGEDDGFVVVSSTLLPVNSTSLSSSSSRENCRTACLKNCSCTAYVYASRCLVWHDDLFDLKSLSSSSSVEGYTVNVRVDASELVNRDRKSGRKWRTIVLITMVGGAVILILFVLGKNWSRRRRKTETLEGPLVSFDYKFLKRATKDFSEKLGRGSFGAVFKGELPDSGELIAVKRLESVRQGEKQFRMEVATIGLIHHVNLIRLRGFCCHGDRRLLVYDYMAGGSLDSFLFNPDASRVLRWKRRRTIAVGIARGLAYLHENCSECIMHCDIKPENILLDADMTPKIADFGMAKLLGHEFSRVLTTVRGTFGYLAPEWITGSAITPKADVYSFGMVLFEIISGRRNSDRCEAWNHLYFPLFAAIKLHEGAGVGCLADSKLNGEADEDDIARVCRVALWCIQNPESSRPTMGEVVKQLEGVLDVTLPPIPAMLKNMNAYDEIEDLSSSSVW